jgi:hypothetical protein
MSRQRMEKLVSKGTGMITGLDIKISKGKFILSDTTTDGRFATDVQQWNSAVGLNTTTIKKRKDATK